MDSKTYELKRTSRDTMMVEDRVIEEPTAGVEEGVGAELKVTGTTRKVLRSMVVNNAANPEARVKATLIHQRKGSNDTWEDVEHINLQNLKAGEGVRLDLDSQTTKNLFDELSSLFAIGNDVGVTDRKQATVSLHQSPEVLEAYKRMISQKFPLEMLDLLNADHPEMLVKLQAVKLYEMRAAVVDEFKASLEADYKESYWQSFFEKNQWIFGYGLKYQFLTSVVTQPSYGGLGMDGTGTQKGDYLLASEGDARFTVLVEVKKPSTDLLNEKKYRNGAWIVSEELSGGVAQLHTNCATWYTDGSRSIANVKSLGISGINTVEPKGILIIGRLSSLSDEQKTSLEYYRRNMHNPEIVTFDELFEKAKFIVSNMDK